MSNVSYLLPDELVPESYFCAKVYIPDRPEYRRAFLGAYFYLSKWLAWERDNVNSAAVAAAVWRDAVEMTMEEWENGCGMTMTCEEIQACINGIDLTGLVQITNNISCGGDSFISIDVPGGDPVINPPPLGDSPQEPDITPPNGVVVPIDPIDVGSGDPPDGFSSWDEYDAGACAAANSLVEFVYQSAVRMALFTSVESGILSKIILFLSSVFAGVWSGFFVPAMLIKLGEAIWSLAKVEDIGLLFAAAASYIETNRQELVCDLYQTRGNASGWENFLVNALASATANTLQYANSSSMWLTALTWMVPSNLAAQMLYGGDAYTVASPVPCDCVSNEGVWTFVQIGATKVLTEGWNTSKRLSFTALCERHSEFQSGYIQAKLDLDPTLVNPSSLTINLLVDERTSGMSAIQCSLASGVGIDQGTTVLSLGMNVIPIDGNINMINIKSEASRHVAGVQTITLDLVLDYDQVVL